MVRRKAAGASLSGGQARALLYAPASMLASPAEPVGKAPLEPPGSVALAPMDGVTDHVYRELWTARGSASGVDFCVSEFIRVSDRPLPGAVIRRACPEVETEGRTRSGVPVLVQLLGSGPEPMAQTASNAIELGAFGVDLNFGCPAKLVNRHDGGASLLKTPERIERVVHAVRARVPLNRPVSAKIRLGWASREEVVAIARAAERGGASWLTVHGRTKLEMYAAPADWRAIGEARSAVTIPVIANGDLNSRASLDDCEKVSGCHHFMLGRGPMARPSTLRRDLRTSEAEDFAALREMLLEYLDALARDGSSELRQVARVKQWLSLARRVKPELTDFFESVKSITARRALLQRLGSS